MSEPSIIVGQYVTVSIANNPNWPFHVTGIDETSVQIELPENKTTTYVPISLCTPQSPIQAHELIHAQLLKDKNTQPADLYN